MENLEFTHLYRETCTERFEERGKLDEMKKISDERRKENSCVTLKRESESEREDT